MEKTINIDNKEIRLNNNVGWTLVYRDQFGTDIIPTLMPLMATAIDIISGIFTEIGGGKEITVEDIAKILDGDKLIDIIAHLGSVEFTDFLNITWALAKCADNDIPEPKMWVRQFDEFPVDIIAPAVAELVIKGMISSKNLVRLKMMKTKLQPLNSTQSSSQGLSED